MTLDGKETSAKRQRPSVRLSQMHSGSRPFTDSVWPASSLGLTENRAGSRLGFDAIQLQFPLRGRKSDVLAAHCRIYLPVPGEDLRARSSAMGIVLAPQETASLAIEV